MKKIKIGFIPTHRDFFDEDWAIEMRNRTLKSLVNIKDIVIAVPDNNLTKDGLVRNLEDSKKVTKLFKEKKVDALIIGAMTFGDELATLNIVEEFEKTPILLFATKEGPFTSNGSRRSDSFCGTISIASGLKRRGVSFYFSGIYFPEEEKFINDIESFIKTSNTIKGFMGARVGMVGTRPAPFETCSINENSLIRNFRIKVIPLSLIDIALSVKNISGSNKRVKEIIETIKLGCDTTKIEDEALMQSAKLELALRDFIISENLSCLAVQCWSSIEEALGIVPCSTLGRLTDSGIPAACETDIYGALSMLIQYKASNEKMPPHFMDWTIKHQEEDNIFMTFHCGNAPLSLCSKGSKPVMKGHFLFENIMGIEKSLGTCEFQLREGFISFCRLNELNGEFKILLSKGEVQYDKRDLRGSWGWVKVENLENLYRTIIEEGFTHHASSIYADINREIENFCKLTNIKIIKV